MAVSVLSFLSLSCKNSDINWRAMAPELDAFLFTANTFILLGWLVVLRFHATLTAKVIIMAVGDIYVFPGFLTSALTQLFFPKQQITFLTCFCRSERRRYAGKKSRLNRGSNPQRPGHESDTLTTELSHPGGALSFWTPNLGK